MKTYRGMTIKEWLHNFAIAVAMIVVFYFVICLCAIAEQTL